MDAELWRYPDRTTAMGKMIDAYLQSKTDMDDGAIHLLFSANRWEKRQAMEAKLESGTTLVVDRYSYSGVAFTAAKGVPGLDLEWCKAPERGLLRPDCVLYLNMPVDQAEKRGGFGEERYETTELQKNVRANFEALTEDWWTTWTPPNGRGGCGGVRTSRQRRGGPMQDGVGVHQAVAVDGVECPVRATHGREGRVGLLSRDARSVRARRAAVYENQSAARSTSIAAPAPTRTPRCRAAHPRARACSRGFSMSERRSVEPREGVAYPVSLGASLSRVGDGDGDDAYVALRYDARVPASIRPSPRVGSTRTASACAWSSRTWWTANARSTTRASTSRPGTTCGRLGWECALIFDPDSGS